MSIKKMFVGEKMPDKNDPKYRERYEREVNYGRRFADKTGINAYHDPARKEGYMSQSDNFVFGTYKFTSGNTDGCTTTPDKRDLERNICAVRDAKRQADIVIVSIHGHQFRGNDKHNTPDFVSAFAKAVIDSGADIVVCHGPHVMRGIEEYHGGIIFHGLGNFILQHESMAWLPEEQYNKLGICRADCDGVADFYDRRSDGKKKGLFADEKSWISFVPSLIWNGRTIKTEIYPIEITQGKNYGLPYLSRRCEILDEISELSKAYNCPIELDRKNCKGILNDIIL